MDPPEYGPGPVPRALTDIFDLSTQPHDTELTTNLLVLVSFSESLLQLINDNSPSLIKKSCHFQLAHDTATQSLIHVFSVSQGLVNN